MGFSSIPLPKTLYDVGPGGRFITSSRGVNAFTKERLENEYDSIKNKYAPMTLQSDAASKMAYANLMGPQFLSKLMSNPDILANLSPEQREQALQMVYRAGSGQGTGQGQSQGMNPLAQPPQQEPMSPLRRKVEEIKNVFGLGAPKSQAGGAQSQGNPLANLGSQGMEPVNVNAFLGNDNNSDVGKAVTAWMKSPEALAQAQKEGMYKVPEEPQLMNWYRNQQGGGQAPMASGQKPVSDSTFAENVGRYEGIKEEGKESGKIRAKDMEELNNTVFNSDNNQSTFDSLTKILASPAFEEIRQVPLAGRHELSYYAKFGTPEQQNMVGQYYTLTGNIIKDSARDFAGAFRKGEQQLLSGMKPSPNDTVDAARGKTEALSYMNRMLGERSKLTRKIMGQQNLNKGDALEQADQQLNGPGIRQEIHEKLNPRVTITNRKTGETITVTPAEAREKYGVNPNGSV